MKEELKKELEELKKDLEDAKSEMLAIKILKMAQASKLRGCKIMQALAFCMVEVIYKTDSKRDKKFFKKTANNLHDVILEGLLNYEELNKEQKKENINE